MNVKLEGVDSVVSVPSLIEALPFLAWVKNTEGRFLAANERVVRSCGVSCTDAIVGKTDFDIWPENFARAYQSNDWQVIRERHQMTTDELINDRGVEKWFQTHKSPVLDANGEVIGTIGFSHDVSARKKAHEEKRILEERLERFEKMKPGEGTEKFIHEGNNALFVISASSELMLEKILPEHPLRTYVAQILKATNRLTRLVNLRRKGSGA
ncbi:MAG: PAS domain-containing protein [Verrucomicrobiota bacterium]